MEKLAELADSQPQMQQMLNTNREIIPNSLFLKKFEKNLGINDSMFQGEDLRFGKNNSEQHLSTDNNVNFLNFMGNREPPVNRKEKEFRTPRVIKKKTIKPGELITRMLRKNQRKNQKRGEPFGLGDNLGTSFILQQSCLLYTSPSPRD